MSSPATSGDLSVQDAPADTGEHAASASTLAWAGLVLVTFVGVFVFWAFDAIPFMDLPAHAGLIALRHRYDHSSVEQAAFVVSLHIGPYSLFRGIGEALVGVLGPMRTIRVIATLPLLATPLALLFARRRLHGDTSPTAGFVGVALSFGLMTLLGFANYLLGVAVLVAVLTLWLELLVDEKRVLGREIAVALGACLLFVSHGHAYVIFLALATVTAFAAGDRRRRLMRLPLLAPSFAIAVWSALAARGTPEGAADYHWASNGLVFQGVVDKLSLLVTPTLMTRSGIDSALGIVMWVVVAMATRATARSIRGQRDVASMHSRALLAAAAVCAIAFAVLPHSIGWFGFVDGRFVPLVLVLCFMAMRRSALAPRLERVVDRGSIVAAALLVVVALVAEHRFQAEARGYDRVLAKVPAGASVLNLPLDADSDVFAAHPFIHYDKLALCDRPIVPSDLWFHQGTGVYPKPGNPALALPTSYEPSHLERIDWPAYRIADWDYVLVRTRPDAPEPAAPAVLQLVEHEGGWWLYHFFLMSNSTRTPGAGSPP